MTGTNKDFLIAAAALLGLAVLSFSGCTVKLVVQDTAQEERIRELEMHNAALKAANKHLMGLAR